MVKISELPIATSIGPDDILVSVSGGVTSRVTRDLTAPRLYFDPHDYGAKGDAVGLLDATINGNLISSPTRDFKASDVGKTFYAYTAWETPDTPHTITSVDAGVATIDYTYPFALRTNQVAVFGTDDTLAIEAALTAASTVMTDAPQSGDGSDPAAWGPAPTCGTVKLHSAGYLVKNTQARWNAGKPAAINVPRRCGLEGSGPGQTAIYVAPGNYGHGVANAGALVPRSDEIIRISSFDLYMNRQWQDSNCLDGIYFRTAPFGAGYTNVDPMNRMYDLRVMQSPRNGVYMENHGGTMVHGIQVMNPKQHGYHLYNVRDSFFNCLEVGGAGKSGFRLNTTNACRFTNLKAYYCGTSGGTNYYDSANFAIEAADSYRKNPNIFVACESQESWGSGWVIGSGLGQFSACLSSDPKRSTMGAGSRPDICASYHLLTYASYNVFDSTSTRPALGLNYGSGSHYGGDYAVYIGSGCVGNQGGIYTLENTSYNVSKLGGTGITNKTNARLRVDEIYMTSSAPNAPTSLSAYLEDNLNTLLSWTAPTDAGGWEIEDYKIEYKLSSEPTVWTEYIHSPSTATSISIPGLTIDATYNFRVSAKNYKGFGTVSSTLTFVNSATAPLQVTGLSAKINDASVYLSWTAPRAGGSAITDYLIEYKLASEPTVWTTFSDGTSTATTTTVTGLTNGSSYNFRVSAINAVGTGTASATVTQTPSANMAGMFDPTILMFADATVDSSVVAANGTLIETWQDLTGNGYHFTQSTSASKPSKGVQTFTNAALGVSFDGTDDFLNFASALRTSWPDGDFTLFMTYQLDTAGATKQNALFASTTATSDFFMYERGDVNQDLLVKMSSGTGSVVATPPNTSPHVVMVRREGSEIKVYRDGGLSGTLGNVSSNPTMTDLVLGRFNAFFGQFDGVIGAVALYDSALPLYKCATFGQTLATKFGVTWVNPGFTGSYPLLGASVASTIVDLDATCEASYPGTGQLWYNIEYTPSDSALPTDYDFVRGDTNIASTNDPTFNGTAGTSGAYWTTDGGDTFTISSGNTAFINALQKTTGGTDFWVAVAFRGVDNANRAYLYSTRNGDSSVGTALYSESNEVSVFAQRGDTNVVTQNGASFTPGTDFLVIYSKQGTTLRRWANNRTATSTTFTANTCTSNAASALKLLAQTGSTHPAGNGTRMYAFAMGNGFLDDTAAGLIFDAYNTRHGRTYA